MNNVCYLLFVVQCSMEEKYGLLRRRKYGKEK